MAQIIRKLWRSRTEGSPQSLALLALEVDLASVEVGAADLIVLRASHTHLEAPGTCTALYLVARREKLRPLSSRAFFSYNRFKACLRLRIFLSSITEIKRAQIIARHAIDVRLKSTLARQM